MSSCVKIAAAIKAFGTPYRAVKTAHPTVEPGKRVRSSVEPAQYFNAAPKYCVAPLKYFAAAFRQDDRDGR